MPLGSQAGKNPNQSHDMGKVLLQLLVAEQENYSLREIGRAHV